MNRYDEYTLSDYFCEMSMGTLDVVGDEVWVELHHPSTYYRDNGYNRGLLNYEVLLQVDNETSTDFSFYDNWTYTGGNWQFIPDGTAEMIMIDYRTIPNNNNGWFWNPNWSGEASLSTSAFLDNTNISSSSGITAIAQAFNFTRMAQIMEHEMCHRYIWHSNIGLMTPGIEETSFSFSPFERTTLTYINPTLINPSPTVQDIVIDDYISKGDVYKIQIPGSSEEFWIVNHQKVSKYDGLSRGSKICYDINGGRQDPYCPEGKGLYFYHNSDICANNFDRPGDIENSDGKYNWIISATIHHPIYGDLPIYEPTFANPQYGYDEYMKWINGNGRQLITLDKCSDIDPPVYNWSLDYWGDGKDAFNFGIDEIISPYSNPSTNSCSQPNNNSGLTMRITGKDFRNRFYVRVYLDDNIALQECPPSKPKNLQVKKQIIDPVTGKFHPKVTWSPNIEPDFINNGYYRIYKGISLNCNVEPTYAWAGNLSPSTTQFIDEAVILYPYGGGQGLCTYQQRTYYYKIEAVDNTELTSLKSDNDYITGWLAPCEHNGDFITNNYSNFKSYNYPNPFNPTTEILFTIPFDMKVKITVYNLLGEVVSVLLNEYILQGNHKVKFNGDKFASGIYFYKIEAGNFTETKKMVLIK